MKRNQKGLTLIEMMIAIVIGLMITSAVMTMFISNIRSNRDSVAMIRLNQELRGVMTFVSDELKRTGYSTDPDNSDFIDELRLSTNCLHYAYDDITNGSNTDGVLDNNEKMAFQFKDDAVRWGQNVPDDCDAGGNWERITEPEIAFITAVTISPNPIVPIPAGSVVDIYQITVSITGTTGLSGGTTASRTISEIIRLRNDDV